MKPVVKILLLILLIPASQGLAETRYISDQLVVTVRSGQGTQYSILETLRSDSAVEILEDGSKYVKARTRKGTEGYILKQYISSKLPKSVQIKRLQAEVTKLNQSLEQVQQQSAQGQSAADSANNRATALDNQLEQTRNELKATSEQYEQLLKRSQNVVSLTDENEQLVTQNADLNKELMVLREENINFHRSNMVQWFLAGGGVFFGGWLIGKISRKKQRSFSRI